MNIFISSINTSTRTLQHIGVTVLALGLGVVALLLVANQTTERSFWSRIIAWRQPRFEDFATKFPARTILNGPVAYHFHSGSAKPPSYLSSLTYQQGAHEITMPLDDFLVSTGTRAFLVLKNDQLLYERYFHGADRTSIQTSFSVAKSFGSALIGIAIDEGYISTVQDPITEYLPELASQPGLEQVRLRDLLTMSSGLRFNGSGSGANPFGDDARAYYDPDLRSLALGVRAVAPPGSTWQYNNFHPLLLGMILERATERSVSTYLSEKLWQPLGMETPGSWSLDSHHDGFEKMESGLNGRAIDFAKFGLLYLRGGFWQGHELVPHAWVRASAQHDSKMDPAERGRGDLDYGYMWWLDKKAPGRFLAWGNLGQFIYIAPDRDLVLLRFGMHYGIRSRTPWFDWVCVLRDLASQVPS